MGERERLAGFARAGIVVREAVTYGGSALWPLSELGTAIFVLVTGVILGILTGTVL